MKQKSRAYPYFVANQVLKSKTLNDAFFHIDEQGRLTRANLFGHGILNGLSYTVKDGVLTINRGEAINSKGWYMDIPGKQEYRYAVEVYLGKDPATKVVPFNDDALLALLKFGGSRAAYVCFKTEEEAREFHHAPTPISAIPISHYAIALAAGTRNHSRSFCSEDSCDVNVTQKDCEVWPVLVNIAAPMVSTEVVSSFSVPPIFQELTPCRERVALKPLFLFDGTHFLYKVRDHGKDWIKDSLTTINLAAEVIAKDILGQQHNLMEHFTVQKSVWKNVFSKPRELMSRFHASVIKVNRIFSEIESYYVPDYTLQFLQDYAAALREFIEEYNDFAAKHPFLPLRDPNDCLVYLGSAFELDKENGASHDQTYKSHFLKAHDEQFQADVRRLERFLRRIFLLSEAFLGISWRTLEHADKRLKLIAKRPGDRISDRPIPFYYNVDHQDFRECWHAGKLSPVCMVRDYADPANAFKLDASIDNGMELYLQGYMGKKVKDVTDFFEKIKAENGLSYHITTFKLYGYYELPEMYKNKTNTVFSHATPLGGITRDCTIYLLCRKQMVISYAVGYCRTDILAD